MSEQLKLKSNPLRPLHCSIAVYTRKLFHSIEISVRDRHSSIVNRQSNTLFIVVPPCIIRPEHTHSHTRPQSRTVRDECVLCVYTIEHSRVHGLQRFSMEMIFANLYFVCCTLLYRCIGRTHTYTDANKTMDPSRETKTTSKFVQKLSSIDFELKASDNTSCAVTTDNRVAGDETQFRLSRGTTDASK